MLAYFCSDVIGTGLDTDLYRPEIRDESGVEAYAACYEKPQEARAIVLVRAPESALLALADRYEWLYEAEGVAIGG
jgi:hypothetical protein